MIEAATLERAYRVRLRPTKAQARTLWRLFGARRFVWNWALNRQAESRAVGEKCLNSVALSREFTVLRQAPETAWLSHLPREPFNQTLRDLDRAWNNFFAGRAKRPRRRKWGTVNSARFTLDQRRAAQVDREQGSVQLDGVGRVRFRVTEPLQGRRRSVTVSRDGAGRWFACFTADGVAAPEIVEASREAIGIDLGLKDTAVTSAGGRATAPKHLAQHLATLRRYQRHASRQRAAAARAQGLDPTKPYPKGTRIAVSNRAKRTRQRIARLHARITDARRDHQHQLTAKAVAHAQVICIEDLAVKAMQRGMGRRAFRRSVSDAGLGEIRRQIEYKARWHGRVVSVVARFYPSSKTCSTCGEIHHGLKLRDRRWVCSGCGTEHDRDVNAAINIEREGLRLLAATPRNGESNAQGEHACASANPSVDGQPSSTNCELTYRAAKPRPTRQRRTGSALRVEG